MTVGIPLNSGSMGNTSVQLDLSSSRAPPVAQNVDSQTSPPDAASPKQLSKGGKRALTPPASSEAAGQRAKRRKVFDEDAKREAEGERAGAPEAAEEEASKTETKWAEPDSSMQQKDSPTLVSRVLASLDTQFYSFPQHQDLYSLEHGLQSVLASARSGSGLRRRITTGTIDSLKRWRRAPLRILALQNPPASPGGHQVPPEASAFPRDAFVTAPALALSADLRTFAPRQHAAESASPPPEEPVCDAETFLITVDEVQGDDNSVAQNPSVLNVGAVSQHICQPGSGD